MVPISIVTNQGLKFGAFLVWWWTQGSCHFTDTGELSEAQVVKYCFINAYIDPGKLTCQYYI